MTKISDIATGKNLKKLRSGRNHKDEPFVTYDFFVDERTSDKYCPTRYIESCTQKRATSGYQNGKRTHCFPPELRSYGEKILGYPR